jgi:NAD+ kinase
LESEVTVKRVGLVVHGGRAEAPAASEQVRTWCAEHGVACTDIDVWHNRRRNAREEVEAAGDPDLIVTLGGDGTFLRGARLAAANDALLLGIDLGRVGFLTEVPISEITAALDAVWEHQITIDSRMLLTLRVSRRLELPEEMERWASVYGRGSLLPVPKVRSDGEACNEWGIPLNVSGINDIVLEKLSRDHQISVGVYVAGHLLASYSADALVVATPTGSTAYSFAAGGPIVSPRAEAIVFTPVAPHMAFDRSVVVGPDEPVGLRLLERSGNAAVTIDGQLRGLLEPEDWIGVYAAQRRLRAVRLGPTNFYGRLRERMNLTDAPAAVADGFAGPIWSFTTPPPADMSHLTLEVDEGDQGDVNI